MASEPSSSISRYAFDVFISFRGEDTGKNFSDHLYTALVHAGLHTFRDGDEIERGENIKSELERAIKQSRSSVVVLSKNYASSGWCLDELVMIVEQRRTVGHVILPVFYDVDPSNFRKQSGTLAEAFERHEAKFRVEIDETKRKQGMEKMGLWRKALREVADLGGMVLQNQADRHESKFIQIIVQEIVSKLDFTVLSVTPYQTGTDSRVKDINLWFQGGWNNVSIMVICGMGGIGKTAIAKIVYNQNFDKFEGSSFLANIRETAKEPNGLVRLQRQLVSDILKWNKERIYCVAEGINKIKDAMSCKRVLVVLDDVDDLEQVNALLGMRDWLYPGSKIMITTRHVQLLKADEVYKSYVVKELNDDEALCLFSRHAFGQDKPIEAYMEHSKRVIHHCGGLPLALEVLGSSLSGKSIDVWESALAKLRTHFPEQIYNVLKISYDSLDDHEKNLFLDIACFFVGEDKDYTVKILEEFDSFVTIGIQNLTRRGLIEVNEDNKQLIMHQMLRDMGREIVRRESQKEPGKRSRVWCHKDAFNVLRDKTGREIVRRESQKEPGKRSRVWCDKDAFNVLRDKTGTATIEGLSLNLPAKSASGAQSQNEDFLAEQTMFNKGSDAKLLRDEELDDFATKVPMQKPQCETTSGISNLLGKDESIIATGRQGGLSVDVDRLNNERKIVGLRLGVGSVMALFSRFITKMTDKLPHSPGKESSDIILLAGKELEDAPLIFFHDMSALHVLDLSYTSINSLPQSISGLNALQKLILRGCDFLMELPPEIGELTNLEVIDLEGTEIIYLPKEIVKLIKLSCLKVSFYRYANNYQESKHIDKIIPSAALSNLSRLNELSIDVNPDGDWWDVEVKTIIHDLCSLQELRTLKLYLPTIELLEGLIRDSPSLICPALTRFRFIVGRQVEHFLSRLPREAEEEFNNLEKSEKGLKYVNGEGIPIEIIEVLKHANAFFLERHWTVNNLSEFGLQNMDKLKFCFLVECNELRTIIDAKQFYQEGDSEGDDSNESEQYSYFNEEMVLGSLQYLSIHYMKNMESICQGSVGKGCLSNLKFLALRTCLSLTTIFTVGMLRNLVNLEELIVEDCTKISSLVDLKISDSKSGHFLPRLKKILLLELPKLVSISNGLCIAPKLERMVIFYCPKLVKLSTMEVSSEDLKVIKGENEWWGALKWHESDLSSDHQDYLASVFVPLRRDGDLMAQFTED